MLLNESAIKRFVRDEIKRQLNIILTAQAGSNDNETETIENLFPGSPSIPERPVMHPYGFASRAPSKTLSVVAKHGADPSNRMILGHRDKNRPTDLEAGEAIIYSEDGNRIKLGSGVTATNDNGSFKLDADGNWIYEAGTTTAKFTTSGKFSVVNSTDELLNTIYTLFSDIKGGLVTTMLGPNPLVMPTFDADLVKFQSFME